MSLTPVNKKAGSEQFFIGHRPRTKYSNPRDLRSFSRRVCLCAAVFLNALAANAQTSEISGNEIRSFAGQGDTLWLSTTKGLDYTTDAGRDTVLWENIADYDSWPLVFENGRMLAVVLSSIDRNTNDLRLYTDGQTERRINLGYNADETYSIGDEEVPADFQTYQAIWSSGFFWAASADGGLLRLDSTGSEKIVFYPGLNKAAFLPKQFPPDTLSRFPDTNLTVLSLAADRQGDIWVASHGSFWHFSLSDTQWTQIPDIPQENARYLTVGVNRYGSSEAVYATAVTKTADTSFYRLSVDTGEARIGSIDSQDWRRVLLNPPADVSFAPNNRMFLLNDNRIFLYSDTSGSTLTEETAGSVFLNAIIDASDVQTIDIRDIAFFTTQSDTLLWIASNRGLFLSRNPLSTQPVFEHFYREFQVEGDLSEVYAAPGIINSATAPAMFVYKIAPDDRATIDIYDWNMDHVIRINQPKEGSKLPTWDGTLGNNGDKPVAPGVYYFKVHTEKGKRAFGKIVVARTR